MIIYLGVPQWMGRSTDHLPLWSVILYSRMKLLPLFVTSKYFKCCNICKHKYRSNYALSLFQYYVPWGFICSIYLYNLIISLMLFISYSIGMSHIFALEFYTDIYSFNCVSWKELRGDCCALVSFLLMPHYTLEIFSNDIHTRYGYCCLALYQKILKPWSHSLKYSYFDFLLYILSC